MLEKYGIIKKVSLILALVIFIVLAILVFGV